MSPTTWRCGCSINKLNSRQGYSYFYSLHVAHAPAVSLKFLEPTVSVTSSHVLGSSKASPLDLPDPWSRYNGEIRDQEFLPGCHTTTWDGCSRRSDRNHGYLLRCKLHTGLGARVEISGREEISLPSLSMARHIAIKYDIKQLPARCKR